MGESSFATAASKLNDIPEQHNVKLITAGL